MKTLVIHPKDITTDFLETIYQDRGWDVLRFDHEMSGLNNLIPKYDHIIMMGHGTPDGLMGFDRFVIDASLAPILREKKTVCIWCNADQFVEKHGLKGLYSGMIISEVGEAYDYCIKSSWVDIEYSNTMFAYAVKCTLDSDDPIPMFKQLYESADNDPVMDFNRERMYYL